jgi:hypothetical protein
MARTPRALRPVSGRVLANDSLAICRPGVSTERVGLPVKSGPGTQERRALEHSAARIDRPDHPVDGSDRPCRGRLAPGARQGDGPSMIRERPRLQGADHVSAPASSRSIEGRVDAGAAALPQDNSTLAMNAAAAAAVIANWNARFIVDTLRTGCGSRRAVLGLVRAAAPWLEPGRPSGGRRRRGAHTRTPHHAARGATVARAARRWRQTDPGGDAAGTVPTSRR